MPQRSPWTHARSAGVADDIDFEIKGQELQFVEVELDPGESAIAEAGALVWKDASIAMATVFGDASGDGGGGFMGKLLGAGKRLVTGKACSPPCSRMGAAARRASPSHRPRRARSCRFG